MEEKHLSSIDLLRGLAALSVCILHFTNGIPSFLPDGDLLKSIGAYGHLGVYVFFIISGFILPYAMHQGNYRLVHIRQFLSKRIIRIEPPYFASIALLLLLNYVSSLTPFYRGEPFQINVSNLLFHIGYLNGIFNERWLNPVYWTLAIEFQFYIFLAVYYYFISHKNIFLFLASACLFNCIDYIHSTTIWLFHYALFFTLGMLLFKYVAKQISLKLFIPLTGIMIVLIGLKYDLSFVIASLIPVIAIVLKIRTVAFFRFSGMISYSLYLTHLLIGGRIINFCMYHFNSPVATRYFIIIVATGASAGFAWIFYRWVEKPFKTLSKNIRYR